MLSRFHLIPERYRQTDGRTALLYQYISIMTRDKNHYFVDVNGKSLYIDWRMVVVVVGGMFYTM